MEEKTPDKKNYSRDAEKEIKELREKLAKIEAEKVKAERYSRLQAASQSHVLELDKEIARASKMTDEQFDDHMSVIIDHYQRIPVNVSITIPEDEHGRPMTEKYRRDTAKKAQDLVIAERNAGRDLSFETALERVRKS